MKLLCSLAVLVFLGMVAPCSYADPVLAINSQAVAGALVETPVAGGETWVYTDDSAGASILPTYAFTDNNVFTTTFTDIAGVALLNVNDVCANVAVGIAANSCGLGFTFTDASLGTPFLESSASLLGTLAVDANATAVGLEVGGASVGGGSAEIGFNPSPSPTPEPSSLTLLGTGLLGMAGVIRKKLLA